MRAPLTLVVTLAVLLVGLPLGPPDAEAGERPTRCMSDIEGLQPHGVANGHRAVLMVHGWIGSPDSWTGEIGFTARAHNEPIGRSLVDQVKRMDSTDVWLLDYRQYSGRWVTDERVGGTVAAAIDCLYEVYDRPVGVLAHSMGGLALRQVASDDDRDERIAAVATFGTPHFGSDAALAVALVLGLEGPAVTRVAYPPHVQLAASFLEICGRRTTEWLDACAPYPALLTAFDSEAGEALRTGSDELAELPTYPDELPTLSLAGDVEVTSRASNGLFYRDLTSSSAGDLIVTSPSATGRGQESLGQERYSATCRHVLESTLLPPSAHQLNRRVGEILGIRDLDPAEHQGWLDLASTPCLHTRLTRTVELTNWALAFLDEHLADEAGDGTLEAAPVTPREVGTGQAGASPVMIVIDVSGSMDDDDGTGTVRLEGAKDAIADMLQKLRPGTPVGLRSYPDTSRDDCNGGRDILPVLPLDATRATALVDTLTTEGNTPTGPALTEAVEVLRSEGYTDGQLVLVSDGESNCGDPPCEVAQAIRDDGFEITVNTVGFQTTGDGRAELDCIAGETGGQYVDADDSERLAEELRALSSAELEVTMGHPDSVPAGLVTPVEVSVRNPSRVVAEDVELSLGFRDETEDAVLPAVLPPRYRLGNIPAGGTATRTWHVTAGGPEETGTATARVTASGSAVEPVSETAAFAVVGADDATGEDPGELLQTRDPAGPVVILGDGHWSSDGPDPEPPSGEAADPQCRRSPETFAVSLFGADRVDLLTCADAVIEHLHTPQADRSDTPAQLEALEELDPAPQMALLTLGWSDVGLDRVLEQCMTSGGCPDDEQLLEVLGHIELVVPRLAHAYQQVGERLGGDGTVVVPSYPLLVSARGTDGCTDLTGGDLEVFNHLVRQLNRSIDRAAAAAASAGYDVVHVAETAHAVAPSHAGCHPTAESHRAMTDALVRDSRSRDGSRDAEEEQVADEPITDDVSVDDTDGAIVGTGSGRSVEIELGVDTSDETADLRRGDRLELTADGFAPGSRVGVGLEPSSVTLATVLADDRGAVRTTVYMPPSLPAGSHRLSLRGIDDERAVQAWEQTVVVRPEGPAWLLPTTIAAGLAALLALTGTALLIRTRRREEP